MPKPWLPPQGISSPSALQEAIGGHPLVAQTLARRGITDPEAARAFLDPAHYTPAPPSDLPGLTRAADRIEQAIQRCETILVWGDFDVDGQTSTTLLVESLQGCGANVTYHIPVRLTEGHGIKPEILAKFLTPNPLTPNSLTPTLLLTCDTGIAAHEAVEFANSRGLDVIITDHHDLPETLPDAYAIVNPKLLPHPHPLITLPGVGVVYKLVEELMDRRAKTEDRRPKTADRRPKTEDGTQSLAPNLKSPIPNLQSQISNPQSPISNLQSPISNPQSPISNPQSPISNLQSPIPNLQSPISNPQSPISNLDLVALGIVADVAEQTGDARYLLQLGLQALRNTPRLGLQTLMEVAQIIPAQLDEGHIGFGIGPRLNALGRLSDANPIVAFLTTDDPARARVVAHQLEGLNERRKLLTDQIYQAALSQIERDRSLLDHAALVLAHPGWHTGVIGIVASRLVDRFGKPAILLSIEGDGSARGSARSVEGVHITEAIAAQKEMLTGFGGHPMAAGLSLPVENIPRFRRGLSRAVRAMIGDQPPEAALQIDAYLPLAELSLDLVDDLERLAPFGAGNPPLILATRGLKLVSHTVIGRTREHLRLVVADEAGNAQNVLWWRGAGEPLPDDGSRFDLAY
ncbi:MAG: single-stranded-DNA-specific exonuclease RecJ, partial [Chloroflexi bacterium]|nr:single-stranded-DNA-specific exonuclease RecJ [Chloroflexota bacterium]